MSLTALDFFNIWWVAHWPMAVILGPIVLALLPTIYRDWCWLRDTSRLVRRVKL